MDVFAKRKLALRGLLIGGEMYNALRAFELASAHHNGTRKDGVTPEFDHQVSLALMATTLRYPERMLEEVITTILLHDTREDYDIEDQVIRDSFGDRVADAVECVSKKFKGVSKAPEAVFRDIARNPLAAITKGLDRVHNLRSMQGVFSTDKKEAYAAEVGTYFLPMLKQARRQFPEISHTCEAIKQMLLTLVETTAYAVELERRIEAFEARPHSSASNVAP